MIKSPFMTYFDNHFDPTIISALRSDLERAGPDDAVRLSD